MRPARLLLCDDVPPLLEVIGQVLTKRLSSIRLTSAATVDEAFRLAEAERFDAVLTDFHVGGGNGLELCLRLREAHPRMGIGLMSAYPDIPLSLGGLGAVGVDCLLQKPLGPVQLTQAVRYLTQADASTRARIRQTQAFFLRSDGVENGTGVEPSPMFSRCGSGHANAPRARFCDQCGVPLGARASWIYDPLVGDLESARRFEDRLGSPPLRRLYASGIVRMLEEERARLKQAVHD